MWLDHGPASKLVPDIFYSTNFYAEQAVARLQQRNKSRPFWLHLAYQAVHAPYTSPPKWEVLSAEQLKGFRSQTYGSMLSVADSGIANITAEIKAQGAWATTLVLLSSDNGGDCGLPTQHNPPVAGQPGAASNHPLLGRKCTVFEGGTRVAALVSGGLLPPALHGTTNDQLMYIADWVSQ
jgi:arylsulfatase A-like enzyme